MQDKDEIFGTVEPVADEKGEMIDFGLVEDEKAAEFIDHEIEEAVSAAIALEGYNQILDAAKWDGVSKQTAQAMRIGISRIDRLLGQKSALVASLEDEAKGEPLRIGHEKSEVTKEGIGGKIKEVWEKFKAMVAAALEKAKALFAKLTDRNKKIVVQAEEMKQKAKEEHKGPNDENGGRKVEIPGDLAFFTVRDGKQLEGNHYHALSQFAFDSMAKFVQDGIDAVKKGIQDSDVEAIKAVGQREAPDYTGNKFDNIEIVATTEGGWSVEIGDAANAEPAQVQVRDMGAFTKALDVIRAESQYLTQNVDKVGSLALQLTALLGIIAQNVNTADTGALQAVIEVTGILKKQQERARDVYVFCSKAQSSFLVATGLEI
ncbi:putative structural head protein [Pseudomonas phage D6]|nr:putative structural head protein [Pseudomonas phage D6]